MLRRLSWVTTIIIGLQMVLGGIIVGKDAGFACPNWPLCGKAGMPPMSGSLMLELVHRFSALLVAILVLWVAIVVWTKHRSNRQMFWTATWAVVCLWLQMIVGGLIVLFVLPGVVTTIDVVNSMAMLALFVHLSNLASHEHRVQVGVAGPRKDDALNSLVGSSWILFGTAMLAVLVGALFRHTGASQALFGQDSYLASHDQHTPPSLVVSQAMLFIHILTGVIAGVGAVWFTASSYRVKRLTGAAIVSIALIAIQAMVGVASLASSLQFVVVTVHWGMAGLIVGVVAWVVSMASIAPNLAGTVTTSEDVISVERARRVR